MNPRDASGVSDLAAAFRSAGGAHNAHKLNQALAVAQAHSVARSVFIHGAANVAEVAARFPAAFADHHYSQEHSR